MTLKSWYISILDGDVILCILQYPSLNVRVLKYRTLQYPSLNMRVLKYRTLVDRRSCLLTCYWKIVASIINELFKVKWIQWQFRSHDTIISLIFSLFVVNNIKENIQYCILTNNWLQEVEGILSKVSFNFIESSNCQIT